MSIPLDHLVWTEPMAILATGTNKILDDTPGPQEKQFWVTGTLSPRARKESESRGWQVQENSGSASRSVRQIFNHDACVDGNQKNREEKI